MRRYGVIRSIFTVESERGCFGHLRRAPWEESRRSSRDRQAGGPKRKKKTPTKNNNVALSVVKELLCFPFAFFFLVCVCVLLFNFKSKPYADLLS